MEYKDEGKADTPSARETNAPNTAAETVHGLSIIYVDDVS